MYIKDFFRLGSKLASTTFQARPLGLRSYNAAIGEVSDKIKLIEGDYNSTSLPVTFKQEDGKELRDVLDTGWAGLYLISDRMQSLSEEHRA